jgi:hypothetical protein
MSISKERVESNLKFFMQKENQYPFRVATKRNNNVPRPEYVHKHISGFMCRIPLGDDYIVWMFNVEQDKIDFAYEWKDILI